MATSANKGNPKKVGFFDWLIEQINSGRYKDLLHWTDENHTTFRIRWKHQSNKNLVADDYEIFKAWAMYTEKYNEDLSTPSKCKLNFRCAMNSTKRFEKLVSNEPDFRIYKIIPLNPKTESPANPSSGTSNASENEAEALHFSPYSGECPALHQSTQLHQKEIDAAFQTLTLENRMPGSALPNENAAGNFYQTNNDTLQWIMQQQSQLNLTEMQHISWAPIVTADSSNLIAGNAILYEQRSSCETPQVTQNGCLPIGNGAVVEPLASNCYQEGPQWLPANPTNELSQSTIAFPVSHAQQNFPGANQFNQLEEAVCDTSCFVDNIYLNQEPQDNGMRNNEMRSDYPLTANQEVMMEQSVFVPSATLPIDEPAINNVPSQDLVETAAFNIKVSIYYHNKLQEEAEVNSCMFTYNQENCHQPHNTQVIQFPNPEVLSDQKRVRHTLTALNAARLLLYQKNGRIWAKRLGTCQVFHAFSKELDNPSQDPPRKLLPRNVETEIFDYEQFCRELADFRVGQRSSSPDYTIYLCFGQRFTASKPKESKLILMKLVPNFCKHWHEFVQREGCSSLNSESVSLQISNSLFDMIEQLCAISMQTETAY
ncbi:interferon regulatory factor 7 isoform X3 [Notechis scutatus]|nr:interferon regulatory factor 7 isoform X3 [Notechis scutatus]XP_026523997.1 interferon regulatory factor 7 isoform X3 [Notechis scutatus]XP_026523998.1 interferon regulatory factor 7 isoform X3 [Notechis scutatus]